MITTYGVPAAPWAWAKRARMAAVSVVVMSGVVEFVGGGGTAAGAGGLLGSMTGACTTGVDDVLEAKYRPTNRVAGVVEKKWSNDSISVSGFRFRRAPLG